MQDGALDLPNYGNMCVVCYAGGQEVKIARAGTAWEQQWGGGGQEMVFKGIPGELTPSLAELTH